MAAESNLVLQSVSLALGVSDNELAVKLAATQTAEVHHSTWTRVLPFIYELLTCNADTDLMLAFITQLYASMVYAAAMCLSICHKLVLYQNG